MAKSKAKVADSGDALRGTPYNTWAGKALRVARKHADRRASQEAFVDRLNKRLGIEGVGRAGWGHWETGRSLVPAGVLLAAADFARLSVDELLAEARQDLKVGEGADLAQLQARVRGRVKQTSAITGHGALEERVAKIEKGLLSEQ